MAFSVVLLRRHVGAEQGDDLPLGTSSDQPLSTQDDVVVDDVDVRRDGDGCGRAWVLGSYRAQPVRRRSICTASP